MNKRKARMMSEIAQKLQTQIGIIEDAIAKAKQNELADIGTLDEDVATICKEVVANDTEDTQQLEQQMIHMINLLDELAEELKAYQDRLETS